LRASNWVFVGALLFGPVGAALAAESALHSYGVVAQYTIPGDGGWDYISIDADARRLYVSHGKQLEVVDADTGKIVGTVADTPGVHGAAIAPELKRGFTSNGGDRSVTIFDTGTLKTVRKVSVNEPDFILYDSFTKRVFPMDEKITVLDEVSGDKVGEVDLGGDPEAAASDGKGVIYVNLADKGAIAVVDAQTLKVTSTYPIDDCKSPHSMAFDPDLQRLFVGCRDGSLAVVDAKSGRIVDRSLMCSGVDAGAYDEERKLVFESCSEGVISVIKEVVPGDYEIVETIKTELLARTMAFDPKTNRIFLPKADVETVSTQDPNHPRRTRVKANSFRVLVVAPSEDRQQSTN
jgi:DNA-binding beta-propeller fold protein YncE